MNKITLPEDVVQECIAGENDMKDIDRRTRASRTDVPDDEADDGCAEADSTWSTEHVYYG